MILVDTSIWIHHLRSADPALVRLLEHDQVCVHPMIIGELALGSMRNRATVLSLLQELPPTPVASHAEVLGFVESHRLYGAGLSLVDVHLLAGVRLSETSRIWTRDRRLRAAAERLTVAADLPG